MAEALYYQNDIHQERWFTATSIRDDTFLQLQKRAAQMHRALSFLSILNDFQRNGDTACPAPTFPHRPPLLDGYKRIHDFYGDHKMVLLCLSPHASDLLQPIDVGSSAM